MNIKDLFFKRLALVRSWMLYSLQSIHTHLMTQVLQSLGQKLDEKINNVQNIQEIINIHQQYIQIVYEYCFQTKNDKNIRHGIEQVRFLFN